MSKIIVIDPDTEAVDLLRGYLAENPDKVYEILHQTEMSAVSDLAEEYDAILIRQRLIEHAPEEYGILQEQNPRIPIVAFSHMHRKSVSSEEALHKGSIDCRLMLRAVRFAIVQQESLNKLRDLMNHKDTSLLPVCNVCKNVYDQEKDTWERLDEYDGRSITFRRVICPDCFKEEKENILYTLASITMR